MCAAAKCWIVETAVRKFSPRTILPSRVCRNTWLSLQRLQRATLCRLSRVALLKIRFHLRHLRPSFVFPSLDLRAGPLAAGISQDRRRRSSLIRDSSNEALLCLHTQNGALLHGGTGLWRNPCHSLHSSASTALDQDLSNHATQEHERCMLVAQLRVIRPLGPWSSMPMNHPGSSYHYII